MCFQFQYDQTLRIIRARELSEQPPCIDFDAFESVAQPPRVDPLSCLGFVSLRIKPPAQEDALKK
jgi:hypothetical protein